MYYPVMSTLFQETVFLTGAAGVANVQYGRVEQQRAERAERRAGIGRAGKQQVLLARHFDHAAVATLRAAARGNAAVKARDVIGPHHHLAAFASEHAHRSFAKA
mgnify:CR=1 FL=1